jgi:membrane protein YdbS with pleckstrin-like domain
MENAISREEVEMLPLHPNVLKAWRLSRLVAAPIIAGLVAVPEWGLRSELIKEMALPPPFTAAITVFVLLLILAFVLPALQYSKWRYAIRQDDVLISYGLIWRVRRCIPRLRIQHVDISSGPFQRMLGIVSLNLFTAGVLGAVGQIPGITGPQAERIREQLIGTTVENG